MDFIKAIVRTCEIIIYWHGSVSIYLLAFTLIGCLPGKKFRRAGKQHKIAVVISARNEEKTIAQLIDSIYKQDYPRELCDIIVIAHNCTDKTAEVARNALIHGGTVYEFNDPRAKKWKYRKKCYGLDYLFEQLRVDLPNGIETYDAYAFFDADNILCPGCLMEVNRGLCDENFDYYNCFQLTKNFDANLIASRCSIDPYTNMVNNLRAQTLMGISSIMLGCGAVLRGNMLKSGFKWYGLAEDALFSYDFMGDGYRSAVLERAKFWDERPLKFNIMSRQQLRWRYGAFYTYVQSLPKLFVGIFLPYDFAGRFSRAKKPKRNFFQIIWREIIVRVTCVHQIIRMFPVFMFVFISSVLFPLAAILTGKWLMIGVLCGYFSFVWVFNALLNTIAIIRERKNIHARMYFGDLVYYFFMWPIFNLWFEFLSFIAVFTPIKWKPIPHVLPKTVEDLCDTPTLFSRGGDGA